MGERSLSDAAGRWSRDQILGCILGGAIGDAIGGIDERGSLTLSDDTQLTLATCESFVALGRIDPEHLAQTFLAVAGARAGAHALPRDLLDALPERATMERSAAALASSLASGS